MGFDYSTKINYNSVMNHIYTEPQFGPTYFRYPLFYSSMVKRFPSNSHFVEVGCFLGKSTSYMCVEIANSNKKIQFDVIDHWDATLLPVKGDDSEFEDTTGAGFIIPESTRQMFKKAEATLQHYQDIPAIQENKFYEAFLDNMKDLIDLGLCNPIKSLSVNAAKLYEDKSLDFVLIDGAHDYTSVCNDIEAWLPKVKSGGVLAGDDWPYPGIQAAVRKKLEGKYSIEIIWDQNIWKVEIL